MTDRPPSLLSYPVVMGLLVALTLGLMLLGRWYWNLGLYTLFLLAVPLALAVAYLSWYRTLPYQPRLPQPAPAPVSGDEEPFEDPVEEADRWDDSIDDDKTPEEPTDAADDPPVEDPKDAPDDDLLPEPPASR